MPERLPQKPYPSEGMRSRDGRTSRILIGSVRALSGTFHDFRASGGNTQRVHYPPATASCDTLCVRHPFAARFGLRRASRPPVDPSPTILRPHHPAPPAPPRPSGKRATSPLQPFDRPRFLFLTSLPPPLPVHHVCPRGRFSSFSSQLPCFRSFASEGPFLSRPSNAPYTTHCRGWPLVPPSLPCHHGGGHLSLRSTQHALLLWALMDS